MPTRATLGSAAVTVRICNLSSAEVAQLVVGGALKLAPTVTDPSPEVNARSANAGPNVVAVRDEKARGRIQLE